jgi:tetratricopeptide (TPR) repeat protein
MRFGPAPPGAGPKTLDTMRNRLIILTAVLVGAIAGGLYGGVFRETSSPASAALTNAQGVEDFKAGFALTASTAALALQLQAQLKANPADEHTWVLLGLAYQQRARETGDPSYYTRSEGALRRARALNAQDELVYSGLGSLALSRHRFRDALALGRRAHELNRYDARNYGVIGDALVELGRYREAFRAFDTMNKLGPSLSSYARVSYGRELIGHTAPAIKAMKLAVDAATDQAEPTAWTHVQLGKLYFNHGRYAAAAREYRLGLAAFPEYAYGLDALAQAEAALGHMSRAIALEHQAVDLIPLPQYVGALGDLYRATGRPALARRQYALIGAIERLLRANGVKTDLEIALFDADHGIALPHALELARSGERDRPSIDGEDVLGWTLARNGRCAEALPHSVAALRLGTQDALKFFHRGMIERCLGHTRASREWLAKALGLSPHFSVVWAPVAQRYAS